MFRRVAFLISLLSALVASPALADGYQSASVAELAASPDRYEGKVVTGGYPELVGLTHYSEKSGKYQDDIASATYRLWEKPDHTGSSVFVVVEDKNRADYEDNLPIAPRLVEDTYYQLQGDWLQRDHVAAPEVTPGSSVWVLRVHGFD